MYWPDCRFNLAILDLGEFLFYSLGCFVEQLFFDGNNLEKKALLAKLLSRYL